MECGIECLKGCKKFAVLGGTFDPIHYGHIMAGKAVMDNTDVEKVLFLPSGDPPHKQGKNITKGAMRGKMTCLALEGYDDFVYSSMEIERTGRTYTIDTVKELKEKIGKDSEFYFVTGADAILLIETWKNYKELLGLCNFIAVTRPGYDNKSFKGFVSKLKKEYGCAIETIEIPEVDISSSEIRQKVEDGINISGLVPEKVEEYIIENGLYK